MSRPASVTAAAIVAFLGCALTLLMGVGIVVVALSDAAPTPMPKPFGVSMGVMFAGLSALGIASGVGILRLREWARIAMLIFAGALTLFCALGAVFIALVPLPPTPGGGAGAARAIVSAVYAAPLAVGVWWLVLFTRRGIVAAFAQPGAPNAVSTRPLAVTIIGYWNIVGGVGTLAMAVTGLPAFVLGLVIQGPSGAAVYLLLGALTFYAGWGLLKLQENARVLSIVLFGLSVVQTLLVVVSPAIRERLFAAQMTMAPETPAPSFDPTRMSIGFMVVAAVIACVGSWLLVRARPAFGAENAPQP